MIYSIAQMFIDRDISDFINPMYSAYRGRKDQKYERLFYFSFIRLWAQRDERFIAEYFSTLSIKLQQLVAVITAASNIPPSLLGIP